MAAETRNTVRFFVNGQRYDVVSPPPTLTILDWLREQAGLCGTKEGCAEGDCGACTTVIAEQICGQVVFRPINACIQFLATLDGRELMTVEGLKGIDGRLHPVQQAMVEAHASQCGFCTPGFVMSLYALYNTRTTASRDEVVQALSGNLCRCTGYRPIIDAGVALFAGATVSAESPGPSDPQIQALRARLDSLEADTMVQIENGGGFWAPRNLDQLLDLLAAHPDATLLAGGTDIGLWVTKDYRDLPELIYLGEVAELRDVTRSEGSLTIGAGVSLTRAFEQWIETLPDLAEIFRRFASPPICSAGTLVGNIANGSPIGDTMPALLCLGSRLHLVSRSGARWLPLDAFYLGYQKKDLRPGELVRAVEIPLPDAGTQIRSYKIGKRFDQDISAVCGAFALKLDGDQVASIAIAYGGMAAIPARAANAEAALCGQPWNEASVAAGIAALNEDFAPLSDLRASADYRRQVAGSLLRKFLHDTRHRGEAQRVFELAPVIA